MASSSKQSRKRKQKNGKKTIKLADWHPEWEQDTERRNRPIDNLPPELLLMILMKLDVVDILYNAQLVCTSWYETCKDQLMWKCIDTAKIFNQISKYNYKYNREGAIFFSANLVLDRIVKHVIDRSCGGLIELSIKGSSNYYLLSYVACRCPQLTRLRLARCWRLVDEQLMSELIMKLPVLTEIDLSSSSFSENAIELIGRSCPLLKSFKFNWHTRNFIYYDSSDDKDVWYRYHNQGGVHYFDEEALAIATNMSGLHHLALLGNRLSNYGLRAILDGCSHLISLDLRSCSFINLSGDLGKRCRDQIKYLRVPSESCTSEYIAAFDEDYYRYLENDIEDEYNSNETEDDNDVSRLSGYYDGYLRDEYDEIVNSKKFIESSLRFLQSFY